MSPRKEATQPEPQPIHHWVVACINCAREIFVETAPGVLPPFRRRCAHCGGWRHLDRYDPHQLALVDSPMRGRIDSVQEAA